MTARDNTPVRCGREWYTPWLRRECARPLGHAGAHLDRMGRDSFEEAEAHDLGTAW